MLSSRQQHSGWRTWQPGSRPLVRGGVRGCTVPTRAASDTSPQGVLEVAHKTYARLLRNTELDPPWFNNRVIECPEVTLSPTWQLPGLQVDGRDRGGLGSTKAGLQILHHLQRHGCYPPPPSQEAAAQGLPVPGSEQWEQLMAATGREASILPCSLQQPCRVCREQGITPSELQLPGDSSTGAADSAAKQLTSSQWAMATHDAVIELGGFLKAADGRWLVAVPVLQTGTASRTHRSSSSRPADAEAKVLTKAAAQVTAAQCPQLVGTHLLVPLAKVSSNVAVQAAVAAACEQQLAEAQQEVEELIAEAASVLSSSSSSSHDNEAPSNDTPSSSSSSSSSSTGMPPRVVTRTNMDVAGSRPPMYSHRVEPPQLCLHVRLRPREYQQLASSSTAVTPPTRGKLTSGAAGKPRVGGGTGAVNLDRLRWAVAPGPSRRHQLDRLFVLGRSGLQGLIVAAADTQLDKGLQWLLDSVTQDRFVSLDMEWPAHRTAGQDQKVALMQLATPTRCLLVRMRQHQQELPMALRCFLRRPDITVLTQSWNSSDSVMLADMGMSGDKEFARLLDLQPLSEAMGYCKPGLAGMVQAVLYPGFIKHQRVTRSKWDAARLSEAQVRYAMLDGIAVQHVFRALLQHHRRNYTLATKPALSGPVFTRTASSPAPLALHPPAAPAPSEQLQLQQQGRQQQQLDSSSRGAGPPAGSECACSECGMPYGAVVAAPALLVCSHGGCTAIPTRSHSNYAQHCVSSGHWQHTRSWECSSCRRFVYEHQWASGEALAASEPPAVSLQLQEAAVIQG